MQKTIEIGKHKIQIRAMTWGEKKQLKTEGFDLMRPNPEQDNDEWVEKVIRMVCGDDAKIDDLTINEVYKLFREIHKFSLLGAQEEKN